uniref:Uncharacterized protein n=1 Tax=Romanomermis culicivorax TaxID=13658 RepID=A0A915JS71_ROMCU
MKGIRKKAVIHEHNFFTLIQGKIEFNLKPRNSEEESDAKVNKTGPLALKVSGNSLPHNLATVLLFSTSFSFTNNESFEQLSLICISNVSKTMATRKPLLTITSHWQN